MRIVIDLTSLNDNFTGIERYALNMAQSILKLDQKNTFELVFKNKISPDFFSWEAVPNVNFHVLEGCNKLLFNQWRLPLFLNRLHADLYLFFAFPMPVLLKKGRLFTTIHDMGCYDCPETMKRQMVWYFRLSYRFAAWRAERIITISEFSKKRIRDILKISEERILVAQCGISEAFTELAEPSKERKQEVREKYGLPQQYYLCLSTLEPRKNMTLLLHAYMELYRQDKIKAKLVLAGRKGWKIEKLLADIKNNGQVVVTGFIEDKDLPIVYQMAKCFVFPSLYEGFGIPPLEAMSQKVPVIASDSSSLPEVLGEAAVYFRNEDGEDLKRVLTEFEQESREKLQVRVEEGYLRSQKYRYEKEAKKISDF